MSCECSACRDMCRNGPCMPTPQEARDLIKRGYGDRLSAYYAPMVRFIAPSPVGLEGGELTTTNSGPCTFFVDGKCEIHAHKPMEGRLAMHDKDWLPIRIQVSKTWSGKRFESVKKAWKT